MVEAAEKHVYFVKTSSKKNTMLSAVPNKIAVFMKFCDKKNYYVNLWVWVQGYVKFVSHVMIAQIIQIARSILFTSFS
uniref:Uncharacterized protein n=1 Tax=Strigamia maritima TaxID=126957 RepID=T1J8C4_STRMM